MSIETRKVINLVPSSPGKNSKLLPTCNEKICMSFKICCFGYNKRNHLKREGLSQGSNRKLLLYPKQKAEVAWVAQ